MRARPTQSVSCKPDFNFIKLPTCELTQLLVAAKACVKAAGSMAQTGHSPAARFVQCDPSQSIITQNHMPDGDVFDDEHGYQFYLHSHRGLRKELAHVHLYFHASPSGRRRKAVPWGKASPSHLVAISLDQNGWPKGFFIPNLCITDGYWLNKTSILKHIQTLDLSSVAKKYRVLARFIQHFLVMSAPIIESLLDTRDALIQSAAKTRPLNHVLADTNWEVLCHVNVNLLNMVNRIEAAANARQLR
jgi:hypothetical protein